MDNLATVEVRDPFQIDLANCWRRLPNKGFFFGLLGAWLALFHFFGNSTLGYINSPSLLVWMWNAYNNSSGDDGHGFLIPFVVLALFWWKRKELLRLRLDAWWPGLAIVAFAVLLHLLGYIVQQPRVSVVAMFIGIYGLTGLAWGLKWLQKSFFPFWLFVFCIPLATLADPITFRLRVLVCWLVEVISHFALAIDVIRSGTQLYDPSGRFQYEVAAACSGIRSLIAIFVIATVYGFVTMRSPWKRLLMMLSAFPLAVLGNLVRMLVIVIAASIWGQDAGNFVHENWFFSLVPYFPAIAGVILIGRQLEDRKGETTQAMA